MGIGKQWDGFGELDMRRHVRRVILMRVALLVTFVIIIVLLASLFARPAVADAPPEQVGIVLIMDNSGSMKTDDPEGLRFTAARLFLALLDDGDAAGVIQFSTGSRPLTEGIQVLDSVEKRLTLIERIQPVLGDGWTDLYAASGDAEAMLQEFDSTGRQMVVVLLTDGIPEISGQPANYEADTLERIRSLNVPVLSIALTTEAQTPFLYQVAADTGGSVVPAGDATDLLDAYFEVFSQIKDRAVLGSGTTDLPARVALPIHQGLAPYVERASFVVSKPPDVSATLLDPDGAAVDLAGSDVLFAVTTDPRFVLVTIEWPAGGEWSYQVAGSGVAQARAVIHSRLRARIAAPGQFHEVGRPMAIAVQITEERADGELMTIIGDASFSATITRPDGRQESLDQFYDDGAYGDVRAGDGLYGREYVNADVPGSYTIHVQGRKGVVPVECVSRVEAVSFPSLVVNTPSVGSYEVRGHPIEIAASLEGGQTVGLDEGAIVALITAPSGAVHEVNLARDGADYAGEFLPTENGRHTIRFTPREATYLGLAYVHEAHTECIIQIVPAIGIEPGPLELGRWEVAQAAVGIPVSVTMTSSAGRPVTLTAMWQGTEAFEVANAGVVRTPAGESVVILHLVGAEAVEEGIVEGHIQFTTAEQVDLLNDVVTVRCELFSPAIQILPAPIQVDTCGCGKLGPVEVLLDVQSNSQQVETLQFSLSDERSLTMSKHARDIAPGQTAVPLVLTPTQGLRAGEYVVELEVTGRDGLELDRDGRIPVVLEVAPVWVRCWKLIAGGIALLTFLTAIMFKLLGRRKESALARNVQGMLLHWASGRGAEATEVDLTAFGRRQINVGSSVEADVTVSDQEMAGKHFVILAEDRDGRPRMKLRPLAAMWKSYGSIKGEIPLLHEETFRAGRHEFQYLSDEGESDE